MLRIVKVRKSTVCHWIKSSTSSSIAMELAIATKEKSKTRKRRDGVIKKRKRCISNNSVRVIKVE